MPRGRLQPLVVRDQEMLAAVQKRIHANMNARVSLAKQLTARQRRAFGTVPFTPGRPPAPRVVDSGPVPEGGLPPPSGALPPEVIPPEVEPPFPEAPAGPVIPSPPPEAPAPQPGAGGTSMAVYKRAVNFHFTGSIGGGAAASEIRAYGPIPRAFNVVSVEVIPISGITDGQFIDVLPAPEAPAPQPGAGGTSMAVYKRAVNFHFTGSIGGGAAASEIRAYGPIPRAFNVVSVEVIPISGITDGQFIDVLISQDQDTTDTATPTGTSIFPLILGLAALPTPDDDRGLPVAANSYDVPVAHFERNEDRNLKVRSYFRAPAVALPNVHVLVVYEELEEVQLLIEPRPPLGDPVAEPDLPDVPGNGVEPEPLPEPVIPMGGVHTIHRNTPQDPKLLEDLTLEQATNLANLWAGQAPGTQFVVVNTVSGQAVLRVTV